MANEDKTESFRSPEALEDIYRATSAPIEVTRAEGEEAQGETLSGYFSVFSTPYRISSMREGDFMEVVDPGAFARAINERGNSIRVLLEHGYDPQVGNKPLGKMRSINEDSHGGHYEADLYTDASYVRDLIPALKAGDYEASFRFRVREDEWNYEPERTTWNPEGLPVRTLKDVDVIEVGPSLFGANPAATSMVRSATDKYRSDKDLPRAEVRTEVEHTESIEEKVEEAPSSVPAAEIDVDEDVRHEEAEETETVEAADALSEEESRAEVSAEDDTATDNPVTENSERKEQVMTKHIPVEERRARLDEIDERFAAIDAEYPDGDYTDEVDAEYEGLKEERKLHEDAIAKVEARKADILARSQRGSVDRPVGGARVTQEPETYRKGGQTSYFKDLYRGTMKGDHNSLERLARNDAEVRAGITTVDGAGGEFVPPLWMVNEFVELARAGRVTADQLAKEPLPSDTDAINLPRLASGTSTAEQLPANQNTAISETDATSDSVTANVATIAGGQTLSVQSIEQSPVNMDGIILRDLAKDYAVRLDTFVLSNNAAGKRGLLNVTGINSVTLATPDDSAALYLKVADAVQQVYTGRFDAPDRIIMHPRRWAALVGDSDSTGRPLVTPVAQAPQNVIALAGGPAAQGFVGSMQGLPVFVDPNIPTNGGVGTNEDVVIVLKADDSILFEGTPRAEAFRETKADTMSVYLRFYNFVALHSERYPASISVISGAGLATPTF